jgi:release factor glutamine methyltransferase
MSRQQALSRARSTLAQGNIEDAPLEGELLLRHVLGISRTQLYLDLDRKLSPNHEEALGQLVKRRLSGEPAAYITNHCEFYGLDFHVDSRVLIPRPESELLVEKTISLAQNKPLSTIAEVGTGSGAVAISLALELPQSKIYATDISAPALEVARINCRRHGVIDRVCLLHGDMLDSLPEAVDLIIANLPYVRKSELSGLRFEPRLALDGGSDGMGKIRRLCRQAGDKLRPDGSLFLEIGEGQGKEVTALLNRLFPGAGVEVVPDLSGIGRVVSLSLT